MQIVVFDTETTGLPARGASLALQPSVVQYAVIYGHIDTDTLDFREEGRVRCYVNPGKPIPPGATAVHRITDADVLHAPTFMVHAANLRKLLENADVVAGHNVTYDLDVLRYEFQRLNEGPLLLKRPPADTMLAGTDYCKIPGRMGSYKWPKLMELHGKLFGGDFQGAHDALSDVEATLRCLLKMVSLGLMLTDLPSAELRAQLERGRQDGKDFGAAIEEFYKTGRFPDPSLNTF